ncbi:MAG TPA: HEAT repeat domain-containing protein [Actinoplanes sp.]|nr:HEAT repeat domain-containing protein [Actinoplanes sp.]
MRDLDLLVRLGERLDRPGADSAAIAEQIPSTLTGVPEADLLLAGLHQRLWRFVPPDRRPRWRSADLPVVVRVAWLRAEIVNEPATVRAEPAGEMLYQAVAGIVAAGLERADELIGVLAGGDDPVLHSAALQLVRTALLSPARACAHLERLLDTPSPAVAVEVLRELAEPWAALSPLPRLRLHRFLADPATVEAAITVAGRHGHGELLWTVVTEAGAPPRARQKALRALGELAGRAEIPRMVAVAGEDPLLFGAASVGGLRALHRRGIFPGDDDAAAVVDLALADHRISAAEVTAILFTCRHAAFRALIGAGPLSARRLELLVELDRHGSGDLPVGAAVTALLPGATRPEPILDAIRELRHEAAEEAVLDVLPRAPGAALSTLEAIGGSRTVAVLAGALGLDGPDGALDPDGAIAPYLDTVQHRATELLWHLTEDPGQRRRILERLNPHDLPRRIITDLGGADSRELTLLTAGVDADDPQHSLLVLARNGDASTLPAVSDVLLRLVADLAAPPDAVPASPDSAASPGSPGDGYHRPAAEPVVHHEVVTAIRDLGARLHERGKLRPYCLRTAGDPREAGNALVATLALDLLDRPDLSAGEQVVLLALLREAPYPGTHSRVHRLLRSRDRHVRKQVIALLATGDTGGDAEAMSAGLIRAAAAGDAQTVRQVLSALGQLGARWAAPVIATGLDHPTMNVKKTAAEALIRAGAPEAVPKMLFWLGRHDNPGLRATLVEALRATLGDAYPATVLAAAEQATDDRSRDLLLSGLDRLLPAQAVGTLTRQGSPIAAALLGLIATDRIRLHSGTVADLSEQLAAHGITAPAVPSPDLTLLTSGVWDTEAALRLVHRPPGNPTGLRPLLTDWLRLAATDPATFPLLVQICPAPWSAAEVAVFAGAVDTLVSGLSHADVLPILEAVAPTLPPARALNLAAELRRLPPAGSRSVLPLLRLCGAIPTRADVDKALATAPWPTATTVLRDAFAITAPQAPASPSSPQSRLSPAGGSSPRTSSAEAADAWRIALDSAVRSPATLAAFRGRGETGVPSRSRLSALADVYPSAGREVRTAILDWMEELQPLGAAPWTLAELRSADSRNPRDGDLDQPRSAAQRARLLAGLASPDPNRRDAAATALRDWPEPEIRLAVLRSFLSGRADVEITTELAQSLATFGPAPGPAPDLAPGLALLGAELRSFSPERVVRVVTLLRGTELEWLLPLMLEWWVDEDAAVRAAGGAVLSRIPADTIADGLRSRLAAGSWGFLDLIADRPLVRTAALTETVRRLRADGHGELADRLLITEGPIRRTGAAVADADALVALRQRPEATAGRAGPSRSELFELVRDGRADQVRRALTQLAEAAEDSGKADPELQELLGELIRHPESRVRAHAHRLGRRLLDRDTYLRNTTVLLEDTAPEVVRSAIGTLGHGRYEPAIPAIVGLLVHPHTAVRRAAAEALTGFGQAAVPALRYASGHARPDRRHHYTDVLDRITSVMD